MNRYAIIVVLILSGVTWSGVGALGEVSDPSSGQKNVRVLFIGNSLVACNDLPQIFKTIVEQSDRKILVDKALLGNATFKNHWDAGSTATKLRKEAYDVVILQNQSMDVVNNLEQMTFYARKLGGVIDQKKSRKFLFLTMPYSGQKAAENRHNGEALTSDGMYRLLEKGYVQTAKAMTAEVIPAGLACQMALQEDPSLKLLSADGVHTSKLGSTLIALVMYQTIFEEAAKIKKAQLTVDITDAQFERLEKIVLRAVKQFDEKFPELKP